MSKFQLADDIGRRSGFIRDLDRWPDGGSNLACFQTRSETSLFALRLFPTAEGLETGKVTPTSRTACDVQIKDHRSGEGPVYPVSGQSAVWNSRLVPMDGLNVS
jgi:hypothetical protein